MPRAQPAHRRKPDVRPNKRHKTSAIRSGLAARAALLRGIDKMARLVRPTLGPLPRTVAVARITGTRPPEILDHAAIIARRTLEFRDPFENMGGMLIRHLVWRVFDQVGDGGATAAVLAQALVREGGKSIAAGANPVFVKRGIELGLAATRDALQRQARTIDGQDEIARAVAASLHDDQLAAMIGEVVDAVGADGAVIIEDAPGIATVHEYMDGVRWNEGLVSSFMLKHDEATDARLLDPRILITDYVLQRAEQLLAPLEACVAAGARSLLVIAPEVRDGAIGMLVANRDRGVLDAAVAVKAPSFGVQRTNILEDIAIITGGRCISEERGQRLADVTAQDLGKARHAWATRRAFGILGGQGSKPAIRERISDAKAELRLLRSGDQYETNLIRERIGKLAGLAAIVRVGAPTSAEQEERKLRIEAAVKSARSAVQHGVVPGGGAALLACVPFLNNLAPGGEDESVGIRALAHALAQPMRAILRNAGIEPEPVLARARACPGRAFDVVQREWVDPWACGLVDPLPVALAALDTSVSAAMTALTAEVLVHRSEPPTSTEP
ncbi:MAG TPA: chaperonin GroEL [Chloroflexota bacterium]|nr:chaperonin GroEL [Chloroflexota bacterium]